jgi:tetratricopeptide (TPR) repeat protein
MKNFQNREVRVFISSTFRGMYYDRKALVDHVFPEIRRRCSERGIGFTEVDLRWGITEDDVKIGSIVDICFQQIDNCQPFFIGLLGEYYGSNIPPEQRKIVCAAYPWIDSNYIDRSITELEMLYAVFNVGQNRSDEQHQALVEQALFYFRDPNYAETVAETDAAKRAKQQNLKQHLRQHGCQIQIYNQPEDLKSLVIEPLWKKISKKFPDTPTAQQQADFQHDAFAATRQRVYIKRQQDFDRLSQHAQSDDAPLIIYGESGSGKTALLANWAEEYKKTHPEELVIWHFCGSSADSTNPIELLRRIMQNLKTHFNMEEELPTTPEAIKEQFGQWLANATKPVILIIDGFNQLQETEITRGWWHYIPAKTRLFVSTISSDGLPADWQRWQLGLLTEESARQALITEYLQQYGKRLADKPMQELLEHSQTANPLYLQVILEELRVFGEFDKLEDHLKGYLQTETIPALYEKVLARLEADYQPEGFEHLVADSLSLLWAARQGLNEAELLKILNIPQAVWSPLYLALQNALVSRGGLLSFFHDYLKQAVENRYLSNHKDQRQWHLRLANYFDQQELDSRIANELPWQLQRAGDKQRLLSCISDIPMFLQFKEDKYYELWGYWLGLEPDKTMVRAYGESLAEYEETEQPEEEDLSYVLNQLGMFFEKAGYFSAAIPLLRRSLSIIEKVLVQEHPSTATLLNNLAELHRCKGDYNLAEPLYKRALYIRETVLGPEHPDTAIVLNNLALLLASKKDYKSAEPLYQRALAIAEKVCGQQHPLTVQLVNNLALLHQAKKNYESAEPLYQHALAIREQLLGKEHPLTAQSLNNLAYLYQAKENYDSAQPLFQLALDIHEKVLGKEHPLTAQSLNNSASLYQVKGDYDSAQSLYQRALDIREKVFGKEHPFTVQSLNNLAYLYQAKGDYDSAQPLYQLALAIREKVLGKEHLDTATSLNELAALHQAKEDYDAAEPLLKRALAIREQVLGQEHPLIAQSLNNLALLLESKKDYELAELFYQRALAIAETVLGQEHPDTAIFMNNFAGLLQYFKGDYESAQSLYQRALAIRERVLGQEHPLTAGSLEKLASLYYAKKDYYSAEPLYQRALKIVEKALGAEHSNTVIFRNNLEACREKMDDIKNTVLDMEEHPDTAIYLNHLAELYQAKGDYDSTEQLYQRALSISENVWGKEHSKTANSLNNLALLLKLKGDYDSAEPLLKRALSIIEKILGLEHPDTAVSMNNLASLLTAKGNYDDAEQLYQRALEITEKALGPEHPNTAGTLGNLAELLRAKEDYDSAEPLAQRALEIDEKVFGKEHSNTAISLNNLALLYQAKGDYGSAEPLYQRALEIFEKVLGEEYPNTVMCRDNLEYCRAEMNKK